MTHKLLHFGSKPVIAGFLSILVLSACESTSHQDARNEKPQTSIEAKLDQAMVDAMERAESTSDPQEAIAIYDELYALQPNDPGIATRYARALRNDEQLNKAKTILKPFIQGSQKHPEAITELAMVHLALGEFKDAELRSRETITMLPENGRAFLALGTALDAQKYHEQAETAFRRGIEYWRGDPSPILNNLALNLASQGKLNEAVSVLERAREAAPNRMEIERNYRIISTLLETTGPVVPKPNNKPRPPHSIEPAAMSPSGEHKRPQPVLENDPALKNFNQKTDSAKIDRKTTVQTIKTSAPQPAKQDMPSVKAAEVQEATDAGSEASAAEDKPVPIGPRTIQSWKSGTN